MLRLGSDVLPVATTTAITNVTARRRNTIGRSRHDAQHARTGKVTFHFDELSLDGFARQSIVDEHHSTVIISRQRIASSDEALDAQLASCADSGFGAAHRHRP
jgi:hypothetical protein